MVAWEVLWGLIPGISPMFLCWANPCSSLHCSWGKQLFPVAGSRERCAVAWEELAASPQLDEERTESLMFPKTLMAFIRSGSTLASPHPPQMLEPNSQAVPQPTLPCRSPTPWNTLSMLTHQHSLGLGVVLSPDPFELIQVMGPEDGPVPCQVVKVVHDDSHEEVNDLRAEERTGRTQLGERDPGSSTKTWEDVLWSRRGLGSPGIRGC